MIAFLHLLGLTILVAIIGVVAVLGLHWAQKRIVAWMEAPVLDPGFRIPSQPVPPGDLEAWLTRETANLWVTDEGLAEAQRRWIEQRDAAARRLNSLAPDDPYWQRTPQPPRGGSPAGYAWPSLLVLDDWLRVRIEAGQAGHEDLRARAANTTLRAGEPLLVPWVAVVQADPESLGELLDAVRYARAAGSPVAGSALQDAVRELEQRPGGVRARLQRIAAGPDPAAATVAREALG